MRNITTGIPLAFALALLSAGPAFTQTTSSYVANVYVQGSAGVYVYSTGSTGQLTLVKGSPFAESGQMEAVRGTGYLISVGTNYLHSYHLTSNGGVGSQAAQIDTASYSGADCGSTIDASILDHTGQYFSVQLYGASTMGNGAGTPFINCSALQTYKYESNGQFTFLGDTVSTLGDDDGAYQQAVSTYSSNDLFAYGAQTQQGATVFDAFRRGTAGDLVANANFTQTGPTASPSDNTSYEPWVVAADPANHLAAVMNQPFGSDLAQFQLASFTINSSTGSVTSTNTYANMPILQVPYPTSIAMSWAGNLVAVGSDSGMELFHFNGASPATAYGSVLLPKVEINQLAWDKSNHLYALSYASGELYVYTVTTTSVSEAPGSPYKVAGAYGYVGLIAVPTV